MKVESTGRVAEVAQEIQVKLENVGVFTADMAMAQVNQTASSITRTDSRPTRCGSASSRVARARGPSS